MKHGSRYRIILMEAATVLILLCIGAAQASAVTVDRIVAVVNNEVITL